MARDAHGCAFMGGGLAYRFGSRRSGGMWWDDRAFGGFLIGVVCGAAGVGLVWVLTIARCLAWLVGAA